MNICSGAPVTVRNREMCCLRQRAPRAIYSRRGIAVLCTARIQGGEEKLFTDTGGKGYWPLRGLVERQYGEERERERTINKQWSRTITRRMFYMYLNR